MKKILLLGASGSIGKQSIDIINQHLDEYQLVGASVGNSVDYLLSLIKQFDLKYVYVKSRNDYQLVKENYPFINCFFGENGLVDLVNAFNYDLCINALQGFVGLIPTMNVLERGIDVALANKETLVAAGDIVMQKSKEKNCKIIPIDSEHSAIFQCLNGNDIKDVKKLIITASGGPFFKKGREELKKVTKEDVLKHPNWSMGEKITVDSATMMNKGFEVIEAHHLYNIPYEKIETIIHPQSIIHSLVEYRDHSVMAQLGNPDMRLPIQYALSYPKRLSNSSESLDLVKKNHLDFYEMDFERFPLLKLAFDLGKKGGNLTAIMNGANEASVRMFLNNECEFLDIENYVFETVKAAKYIEKPSLQEIVESNNWAIEFARSLNKR